MIKFLKIKNLATIEDLELNLTEGFSILTGETGAGKSIIIDGIRLVLGEKASPDLIRAGKKEASIEGVFEIPRNITLQDDSLPTEEGSVFIQRQISEGGGGKAYVNGVLCPIRRLKDISPVFVDVYGQNDHIFLLHLENHLDYLDNFISAAHLKEDVGALAREIKRLVKEKKDLESRERERTQRLDFLEFQIKEIERARLTPGEEEELQRERHVLRNSEKIRGLVEEAVNLSYDQEDSLSTLMARLQNILNELISFDPSFREMSDSISQFTISMREFSDFLIRFREKQETSPEKLEKIEVRLDVIEKLKRKYGNTIDDILVRLREFKEECDLLNVSREKMADLDTEIRKKTAEYADKAERLSRMRREGTVDLEKNIEKEIALLGMKKARFKIQIAAHPFDLDDAERAREQGLDDIEFLISPNPGEELKPLRKIASGGELSRVMLALKTVGKEKESLKTLIFDEIDSGIGGKTAEFIAQKLRDLAKRHQILCITHLPQIASFATHHFRIDKKVEKERTYTSVKKLDFEERVAEVARLISGSRITATALQNAREMLSHNKDKGGTDG